MAKKKNAPRRIQRRARGGEDTVIQLPTGGEGTRGFAQITISGSGQVCFTSPDGVSITCRGRIAPEV